MLKLSWESGVSAGVTIGGVNGMKGCLWNISPQHTWEEMLLLRLLDAESRGSSLPRTSSSWADSSRSALEPSCDLRCSRRSMGTCFLAWIKQEWRTTRWNWTFFRSQRSRRRLTLLAVTVCWNMQQTVAARGQDSRRSRRSTQRSADNREKWDRRPLPWRQNSSVRWTAMSTMSEKREESWNVRRKRGFLGTIVCIFLKTQEPLTSVHRSTCPLWGVKT